MKDLSIAIGNHCDGGRRAMCHDHDGRYLPRRILVRCATMVRTFLSNIKPTAKRGSLGWKRDVPKHSPLPNRLPAYVTVEERRGKAIDQVRRRVSNVPKADIATLFNHLGSGANSVGGTVRPSVLALFMFMILPRNFSGCTE